MASAALTKLLTGLATQIKPSGIATQAAKKAAPQIKKSDTILDADFEAPINTRKIKADYNRTIKEQVKRKDLLDNPNKLKKYAKDKGISTNQMLNLIQNNYKNNIEVEKNLKKLISDDSFKEAEKNLKARSKKIKFKDVSKEEGLSSLPERISIFPKPQRMFPEDARPEGGEYLNPVTKETLTGKNLKDATIVVGKDGEPKFKASPEEVEIAGSPDTKGATQIKTILFKKKAGWKWTEAPKGYEDIPTLVSVENKGKHYYALEVDFPKGVGLSRYAKKKSEPRLRPTIKGFVELGKPIGKMTVRGREHPVYDKIINRESGGMIQRNPNPYEAKAI